jgi:hypothetical protein
MCAKLNVGPTAKATARDISRERFLRINGLSFRVIVDVAR